VNHTDLQPASPSISVKKTA